MGCAAQGAAGWRSGGTWFFLKKNSGPAAIFMLKKCRRPSVWRFCSTLKGHEKLCCVFWWLGGSDEVRMNNRSGVFFLCEGAAGKLATPPFSSPGWITGNNCCVFQGGGESDSQDECEERETDTWSSPGGQRVRKYYWHYWYYYYFYCYYYYYCYFYCYYSYYSYYCYYCYYCYYYWDYWK